MMKLNDNFLRGSYTPLVTPFRQGKVDLNKFAVLVERQVLEGSHGIVVTGTTAEPSSLTLDERSDLIRVAVQTAAGRIPVVAATGSQSLVETAELTAKAEQAGVDALLVVTPYYIKPSQRGLVEYFVEIGRRTELPLLIYHIPGRTAVSMEATAICQVADKLTNLVGIKHAATDLELVTELLLSLGSDFRIFCGLESLSLPMMAIGACGVMNAVGNLAPARVAELCNKVAAGNLDAARKLHLELFELNRAIFLDTNPVPLKYMMTRIGLLDSPELRLPLVPLTEEKAKIIDGVLQRAGLLERSKQRVGHL